MFNVLFYKIVDLYIYLYMICGWSIYVFGIKGLIARDESYLYWHTPKNYTDCWI